MRSSRRSFFETYRDPVLSLNASQLRRAGALAPGRTGDWQWLSDGIAVGGIRLVAGSSRIALSYQFRHPSGVNEEVRQIVGVGRRRSLFGERKAFFICPGRDGSPCQRPAQTLYGAGRYFLCKNCVRLSALGRTRKVVRPHRMRTTVALAGLGVAASVQALAGGFMVRENSAEGVATVYAGNGSRASAPSTAFNNPAGMTRLATNEIEVGGAMILPSITFEGGAEALGLPLNASEGGDAGRTAVIPHLYWVFSLTDRLKGGIAVTAPFGNSIEYDSNWHGRYLGIKTAALSVDINPNIAYRLTDRFSLAAGFSAQYLQLDYSSAIPQFIVFGPGTPDALYRFEADSWALGYNVGALLEFTRELRLGLTYRSGIDARIKGSLDFTGTLPFLGLVSGAAEADVHLPATIGASLTMDVSPNFSLSTDLQWTNWSVFERVVIESENMPFPNEQAYRDSWMVSIGGVVRLTDSLTFGAGVGWDQTPVTDRFRAVTLPDEDRLLVGVGLGYQVTDTLAIAAGYQHSFAAEHASMDSSLNRVDPMTGAVVLSGHYNVAVDIVSLGLRFRR